MQHRASPWSAASSWDAMDDCLHSWLSGMGARESSATSEQRGGCTPRNAVRGRDCTEEEAFLLGWCNVDCCNTAVSDNAMEQAKESLLRDVEGGCGPGMDASSGGGAVEERSWLQAVACGIHTGGSILVAGSNALEPTRSACGGEEGAEGFSDTSRVPTVDSEEEEVVLEKIVKRRLALPGNCGTRGYDDDGRLIVRPDFVYLCKWKWYAEPTWEARTMLEDMGYVALLDAFDDARRRPAARCRAGASTS